MSRQQADDDLDGVVGELHVVRSGFDDLPTPVAALEGPRFRYVAVNAAYRALSGHENLVGKTLREASPGVGGRCLLGVVEQVYSTGEPVTADDWRHRVDADSVGGATGVDHDVAVTPRLNAQAEVCGVFLQLVDTAPETSEHRGVEAGAGERHQGARGTVVELQRALLPPQLPVLPRVSTAAGYRAADRDQGAGGDWFDAIPLGEGRIALVVGDIVGHGVAASAAMGEARAILEDSLVRSHDLTDSILRLDELAGRRSEVRASTVCAGILDVAARRLDYITCGHPAPLVVGPDGGSRALPPSGSTPLGTASPIRAASARIESDETVVLFSDGLIERADRTLDAGLDALREIARGAVLEASAPDEAPVSPAERICRRAVEPLACSGCDDDITVLAAHVLPQPHAPMRVEVPASAEGLLAVRPELCRRVRRLGLAGSEVQGLDLATTEAISNVIEHAYLGRERGPLRVDAEVGEDGYLEITVGDQGLWVQDSGPSPARGRGLWIAASLMDHVEIAHKGTVGDEGTRVVLRRRLGHPSHLSEPETSVMSTPNGAVPLELHIDEQDPRRLVATGSADVTSVGELADHLDRSSRGGFRDLTLDVSGLQLLASSAVRILIEVRARLTAHGHELTLVAARGTQARAMLDVVGLPCEPEAADHTPGAWPT